MVVIFLNSSKSLVWKALVQCFFTPNFVIHYIANKMEEENKIILPELDDEDVRMELLLMLEMMDEDLMLSMDVDLIEGRLVNEFQGDCDELIFVTYRQAILDTMCFIKLYTPVLGNFPVDIVVIDNIENYGARFTIIYTFRSLRNGNYFTLITKSTETLPVLSAQSLFPAFNWAEREVWDLFGIFFVSHPDLKRILTDYGFSGYPLRKDFPLSGYFEVQFDDSIKAVEYKSVELSQAFRIFRHTRGWSLIEESVNFDNNDNDSQIS